MLNKCYALNSEVCLITRVYGNKLLIMLAYGSRALPCMEEIRSEYPPAAE